MHGNGYGRLKLTSRIMLNRGSFDASLEEHGRHVFITLPLCTLSVRRLLQKKQLPNSNIVELNGWSPFVNASRCFQFIYEYILAMSLGDRRTFLNVHEGVLA